MNTGCRLFLVGTIFLLCTVSNAQNNYDANPAVEVWQRLTLSIGNVRQKSFDKKVLKYYNILGTGVIFYITHKAKIIPVIITAKHVLKDEKDRYFDTLRVRFSWESNKSVFDNLGYKIMIKHKDTAYYFVLPDTSIDLACVPLTNLLDSFPQPDWSRIVPYSSFATDKDYFEGRDIYTLGYPAAVGSSYWTRGLLRKGIISWLPDSGISSKKFIIDCNVFPGNSGGPVFSFPSTGMVAYDTAMFSNKFYGIVIERRLNYNDTYKWDSSRTKYKKADFLSPESISVGIVEPAKNVSDLLKFVEKTILYQGETPN
jgi:hypothetical protein